MTLPSKPIKYPGSAVESLVLAVMDRIESTLTEVRLPNKTGNGDLAAIPVRRSYFDPTKYEENDLPAVLVRAIGSTQEPGNNGEERTASVEIVLGTYMTESGDDEYAVSVMERIHQDLLAGRILDGRYRLQLPLGWTVADLSQQPWPYWWAQMTATYFIPAIAEVRDSYGQPLDI